MYSILAARGSLLEASAQLRKLCGESLLHRRECPQSPEKQLMAKSLLKKTNLGLSGTGQLQTHFEHAILGQGAQVHSEQATQGV